MIELTKIQKTYKLDLLLKKYKEVIYKNDFLNHQDLINEFKTIQSYIQSRYTIDRLVKKRYMNLEKQNLNINYFNNLTLFKQNVLEIYINVKFCNYYKNIILSQWEKYESIIDYFNKKKYKST